MSLETERLLERIREMGSILPEDWVGERTSPRKEPEFADREVLNSLSFNLRHALGLNGVRRLYKHQSDAVKLAFEGHNVVLQSPTASGKTLAFQIPMLETLIADPDAHALMIYPTKALAKDQEQQLTDIIQHMPLREVTIDSYDGDTPRDPRSIRQAIKQNPPQILRTNPDMLHSSFLGWAEQWEEFYRNLKWVIVDEIHEYRGYFGSNVALLLRRLSYHLRQKYDIQPQFFLSSATCNNALDHAQQLTGLNFVQVGANTDMRPERQYWAVNLDMPDAGYWDQLKDRVVSAALSCLQEDKSVLVFCPTRVFAEDCKRAADRIMDEFRENGRVTDGNEVVQVFRGGLSTEQREDIQERMQEGEIKVVFATNALEVGLNVGGLDGIIMAGFPNNMMSARQQIGRAGRSWKRDAFVLFFPRNNPLDRYYAGNVSEFVDRPLDDLVANHENTVLVERHLPCLLFETGSVDNGRDLLGDALFTLGMEKQASYRRSRRNRPHHRVDIRGAGGTTYDLMLGKRQIGSMSGYQRFREAYEDAVYLHGGESYRVSAVTTKASGSAEIELVELKEEERYLRTNPKSSATLSGEDPYEGYRWRSRAGTVELFYGQLTVTERIHLVEELDERTSGRIRTWEPERASSSFFWDAEACWWNFEGDMKFSPAAKLALEQILRLGTLFTLLADEHDVVPQAVGQTDSAYVVESYEGGIGIASQLLRRWKEVLEKGIAFAESCTKCEDGCPQCIVPPRMREQPDKKGGLALARDLLTLTEGEPTEEYSNSFWEPLKQGRS